MTADPVAATQDYLTAVRRDAATDIHRETLADLDESVLDSLDENTAKAFWLNLYNAAAQDTLRKNPGAFASKRRFFGGDRVTVAGHALSLDDIEHGIVRGSRSKYGLGYLPRLRPDTFERRHRLDAADPRIHFAVNCGASSCPGIAPYTADGVDEELDIDTRTFLDQTSTWDGDTLRITRLVLYYRGDFGGRDGIYDFLRTYDVIEDDARPRIQYRPYDWSLDTGNFRNRETGT